MKRRKIMKWKMILSMIAQQRRIFLLLFLFGSGAICLADEEANKNLTSLVICEGEDAVLSCPPGMQISVHLANYGRFSLTPCNPTFNLELNTQCQNDKTIPILRERCDGRQSCKFPVSNEILGDPCPDTAKYLEVQFKCLKQATTTTTTTTTTTSTEATTKQVKTNSKKAQKPNDSRENPSSERESSSEEDTLPSRKCPSVYSRHIQWPKTDLGQKAKVACPIGSRGHAEWVCSKSGQWYPSEGPDLSRCVSDWSRQLYEDVDDDASDFQVQQEALKEVYSYTRREQLLGGDLVEVSRVMSKVVENYIGQEVMMFEEDAFHDKALKINKLLLESFNHLLHHNQNDAWMDLPVKKRKHIADSMLAASEHSLAYLLPMTKIGRSVGLEASSETIVAKPNILSQVSAVNVYDYVKFPSISLYHEAIDSVAIPREALTLVGNDLANVIFVAYDCLGTYMAPSEASDEFSTSPDQKIVSKVLTVSMIRNRKPKMVQKLERPVILTFHVKPSPNMSNPQCVWWNREHLSWSNQGCATVEHNETTVTCHCNHLTHFAVLMDVHGVELPLVHDLVLTFITYAGCTLSIFCLVISFLAFSIFGDSSCDRTCVHKNLCLTLAIAEAIFLVGIFRTQEKLTCSIIAGALQYFFVAAFAWMLLEGFQLYYMLVQVFPPKSSRKPYLYLFGYGFPALITILSIYWNPQGFGTPRYCWLQTENYFILSFIAPVAIILFCNLIFLIMTLFVVCKHSKVGYKPCKHDMDTIKTIRGWLKGSMALVFLLGLTWTFGLFWLDQNDVWMAYVFAVCNSLQGLFILLFHVIFDEKMKKDYKMWLLRNDWLPLCIRSSAVDSKDRPGTAFLASTATSSAHSGSSGCSNNSDPVYQPQMFHGSDYHSRVVAHIDPRYNHSVQMLLPGQQIRLEHHDNATYEYATIPYDELAHPPRAYQPHPRTPLRVTTPRLPPGYPYGTCGGPNGHSMTYRIDQPMGPCCHHAYGVDFYNPSNCGTMRTSVRAAPPNFKPPPPPAYHPDQENPLRSPVPSSSSAKPPSDDSAYSEGGSFMHSQNHPSEVRPKENSGSSSPGTMLLRMDFSKNHPIICEGL